MEGLQHYAPKRTLPLLGEPSDSTLSSTASPPVVRFLEPSVAIIESSWSANEQSSFKMSKQLYESFRSDQVTDSMLERAAKLFSENYGTWGEHSHSPGKQYGLLPSYLSNALQENPLNLVRVDCGSNTCLIPQRVIMS